jgi:hypothetical protein
MSHPGEDYLGNLVRAARMLVYEAYVDGGDRGALEALMLAALDLAAHVVNDELLPHAAWDELWGVAARLGLVNVFGADAVQAALAGSVNICVAAKRHAETGSHQEPVCEVAA